MGWSYRKSVGIGPFRLNLSKSGIGYSVGAAGFRTGVNARGRSYRSVSVPGTGLRYYSSRKQSTGCVVMIAAIVMAGATFCGLLIETILWRSK
ncbi:MAG TPA: DUF4236 domain-containing protein [Pirellulales bacterium]|jgi:hypothetical protein|nr:DUF4236 domain-containing protein [Pirellulales bacterium]